MARPDPPNDESIFSRLASVFMSPFKDSSPSQSDNQDGHSHRERSISLFNSPSEDHRRLPPSPAKRPPKQDAPSDQVLLVLQQQLGSPSKPSQAAGRQSSSASARPRAVSGIGPSPQTPSSKGAVKPTKQQQLPATRRNLHTKIAPGEAVSQPSWAPPETVADGMLQKLNKNRTKWSLRWFGILPHEPHVLYWWTREPSGPQDQPVGATRLETAHVRKSRLLSSVGSQSSDLLFEIVCPSQVLYFSSASEDDLGNWISFLQPRTHSYNENLMMDDLELRIRHATSGQHEQLIQTFQQKELAIFSRPIPARSPHASPAQRMFASPLAPSTEGSLILPFLSISPLQIDPSSPIANILHCSCPALIPTANPILQPLPEDLDYGASFSEDGCSPVASSSPPIRKAIPTAFSGPKPFSIWSPSPPAAPAAFRSSFLSMLDQEDGLSSGGTESFLSRVASNPELKRSFDQSQDANIST